MTGHLFILENTSRPLAETIGASSTMKHGSVRGRTTCEVPTLDDTLESTPFGLGDDVDHFDVFEMVNGKGIPALKLMLVGKTYFLSDLLSVNPCLGCMSLSALVCLVGRFPLGIISYLDGRITVFIESLDLKDGTRACLYYSDWNKIIVTIVYLGHPKFFTY